MSETPVDSQSAPVDPFSPQGAPGVQLIVQLRIYDVLMGIYTHLDPDMARLLADVHREGGLLMSSPNYTGRFVDDEAYGGNAPTSQVRED